MWVKKEQFQDEHFYVIVECLNEDKCDYDLAFTGSDSVVFDSMGTFSYYVSLKNTDMIFKFKNEHQPNGDIITLYATGAKNIKITFSYFVLFNKKNIKIYNAFIKIFL